MATYEITYRRRLVKDGPAPASVDTPLIAADYFRDNCFEASEMWREKVYALFVDRRKRPLGHFLVGVGSDTSVTMGCKLVAKAALDCFASGVILCHNHPSGDPRPGQDDIRETGALKRGLDSLDIQLIDHIILGEKAFFSFTEETEHPYGKPLKRQRHG